MAWFILVNHHDGEYGVILYLADVKEKKKSCANKLQIWQRHWKFCKRSQFLEGSWT